LATDVRKDLTVVNPQWTEFFLSYNAKTMKFGISLCPFPLASAEDSSVCMLPSVVLRAKEQSLVESRCLSWTLHCSLLRYPSAS